MGEGGRKKVEIRVIFCGNYGEWFPGFCHYSFLKA
jgi:hypothetical protein